MTYYLRWNLIIFDHNRTTDEFLIDSIGTKSDRWASIRAKQYQVILHGDSFSKSIISLSIDQFDIFMLSFTKSKFNHSMELAME